jgi:glycosyltransferase involved in cell wall biosynthesis
VLREIAESEILIQASAHEGTGLPLLEAMGVGTIPITSDVGIAREVLIDGLQHLIVKRNANDFEQKIIDLAASRDGLSNLCISTFDLFIKKVSGETIEWERRKTDFGKLEEKDVIPLKMRLIWLYRFYRSRWNR